MAYEMFKQSLGMEAIDFQIHSALKKKLIDVFQMGIDFRDNLDYSKVGSSEFQRKEYRVREVFNYVRNTVMPKFKEVLKQEVGFIVDRVYCIGGPDYPVYGMFAVSLSLGDEHAAAETIDRMTATGDYYSSDREAIEDMKKLGDYWDKKTGKITKSVWGKDRKLSVDIYFDVNCAYLVKDFYPEDYAPELTAGEIAAIMCHETGHVNSVVEHAGDIYATRARLEAWTKGFKDRKDPGELIKALQSFIPWLQKKAKEKTDSPLANRFIKNAATGAVSAIQGLTKVYNADPGDESAIFTVGNLVMNVFYMLAVALLDICVYISGLWTICVLFYELSRYGYVDRTATGGKASDIGSNRQNVFLLERWADEYVVRHGLGAELASGLNKIHEVFSNAVGDVMSYRLRHSTLFNCLCKVFSWFVDKLFFVSYFEPVGYEDQYNRLKRIEQDTFAFFKNPNIPGPIAQLWIDSVKDIQADMAKAKTLSDTPAGRAFFKLLRTILSPVSWAQAIYDAKFREDLFNMMNELDDLNNNGLYYQAARLQNLGR